SLKRLAWSCAAIGLRHFRCMSKVIHHSPGEAVWCNPRIDWLMPRWTRSCCDSEKFYKSEGAVNLVDLIEGSDPLVVSGRVAQAVGIVIEGYGPMTSVGELCDVTRGDGEGNVQAEVVGFRG